MAITTYAELITAVDDWTHRSDISSKTPDFIALCENRLYNGGFGSNPLRVSAMQNQDTGTSSSQVITLPTGYLETIRLSVTSGGLNYPLEYIEPNTFSVYENTAGVPLFYTSINGSIKTAPSNDLPYTHDYYKKFDALTASATTNWIITNAPHLYLYGCLYEAYKYINDESRANDYMAQFANAIEGLNKSEAKKFQATPMRVVAA